MNVSWTFSCKLQSAISKPRATKSCGWPATWATLIRPLALLKAGQSELLVTSSSSLSHKIQHNKHCEKTHQPNWKWKGHTLTQQTNTTFSWNSHWICEPNEGNERKETSLLPIQLLYGLFVNSNSNKKEKRVSCKSQTQTCCSHWLVSLLTSNQF